MEAVQWREEVGGTFVAETAEFTMRVCRTANRDFARFLVAKCTGALVGSGTTADVGTAMHAAEKMAERLTVCRDSGRALFIVVDDDQEMRGAIADTLRDGGFDAVEATNAEGALRRLERLSRHVVIVTDLALTGSMDGPELAAAARRLSPGTGVLFTSGEGNPACRRPKRRILAKPFSADRLLKHAATLVKQRGYPSQLLRH